MERRWPARDTAREVDHETYRTIFRPGPPCSAIVIGDAPGPVCGAALHGRSGADAARPAAVLERGGDQGFDPGLCRTGHDARRTFLRAGRSTHRDLRQ